MRVFRNKVGCIVSGDFDENNCKEYIRQGWEEVTYYMAIEENNQRLINLFEKDIHKGEIIRLI